MRRIVESWVICVALLLLVGCGQSINLDTIQESVIGDKFLYVHNSEYDLDTRGTITVKTKYSGLLELYEDNTFSRITMITTRSYKDNSLFYGFFPDNPESVQNHICDEKKIETGTYELSSYREDGKEKIIIILHITNMKESINAGGYILKDTEEASDETKEYNILMEEKLIKSIGMYDSFKYLENELKQTAIEAIGG